MIFTNQQTALILTSNWTMNSILVFILLKISLLVLYVTGFSVAPKIFRINDFAACSDGANNAIQLTNVTVTRDKSNRFIVNGGFNVSETISPPIEVSRVCSCRVRQRNEKRKSKIN